MRELERKWEKLRGNRKGLGEEVEEKWKGLRRSGRG